MGAVRLRAAGQVVAHVGRVAAQAGAGLVALGGRLWGDADLSRTFDPNGFGMLLADGLLGEPGKRGHPTARPLNLPVINLFGDHRLLLCGWLKQQYTEEPWRGRNLPLKI